MTAKGLAMGKRSKTLVLGASLLGLLVVEQSPEAPLGMRLVPEAAALIGRPLTPVSFAGVARRTTRRAVVYSGAAYAGAAAEQQAVAQQQAATAQQQAAVAQQQAATAQQQAAVAQQQSGAPAIGTVVATLPQGCVSSPKGGVEYYNCGGVYYRAAFQGNNLVYVVQQP